MTNQAPVRGERTDIAALSELCAALMVPGNSIPVGADIQLAEALLRRDFDPMKLVAAAWHVLLANAQVRAFLEAAWKGDTATLDSSLSNGMLIAFYDTPLMQAVLKTTPVPDLHFERLTAHVRLRLLECSADPTFQPDRPTLAVASAISVNAFLTEYIYQENDEETRLVDALQARVNAPHESGMDSFALSLLGGYRPLHEVLDNVNGALRMAEPLVSDLLRIQIAEPLREQQLIEQIQSVTAIEDSISSAVQAQYEEHPYPRWVAAMEYDPVTPAVLFETACGGVDLSAFGDGDSHALLFAGCGTGKIVVEEGALWSNSKSFAMDLSRNSLAYGIRRVTELGLQNVTFAQGDLLHLSELDQLFDYISCSGVLHHMADPLAGWQALADVCRPGGVIRLCVYSELARAPVRYVQSEIGPERKEADAASIKRIRQTLIDKVVSSESPDVELARIFSAMDMYTTSMCRDLLFHTHEQDFTIPKIAQAIESLGLTFCGFVDPENKLLSDYRLFAPQDPDGLDLESWHEFELRHPDKFAEMYDFMVQKPL